MTRFGRLSIDRNKWWDPFKSPHQCISDGQTTEPIDRTQIPGSDKNCRGDLISNSLLCTFDAANSVVKYISNLNQLKHIVEASLQ